MKHGRKICQKLYRWGVGENGHPMSCMSCSRRFDLNMCSVNQLNAKTKLTEMWKTVNLPNHNMVIKKSELKDGMRSSRSIPGGKLVEEGFSQKSTCTFINDATRAWNKAPISIKNCNSLLSGKKAIKTFVMTLPV